MKIIIFYHFDSDPRFPHFYYMLGGNLGSLLYADISVMIQLEERYKEAPTRERACASWFAS